MAVTWEVDSTAGLGSNYKDTVEQTAKERGYGSLYYAKRLADNGGNHSFLVRTKKWFTKYQFTVYTRYNSVVGQEVGAGWSPGDPTKI